MTNSKKSLNKIPPDTKFMSLARIFVTVIMLAVMGILTAQSLLGTTGIEIINKDAVVDNLLFRIREGWETIVYYSDDVFANLFWLIVCVIAMFVLLPLMKKIPLAAEVAIVMAWTITFGSIWIFSVALSPTEDSFRVTDAAICFSNGNYGPLAEEERYFRNYSYQLGYVLFNEIIINIAKLFGEIKNLIFLEIINVFLLAFSYAAIIIINSRIFRDSRVRHITSLLLMFAAQPIIFSSFLYGIIPGFTFAVFALMFMILYLQKNKIIYGILMVIFLAISVMIKTNNYIILAAIGCIVFVMMFKRKKFVIDTILLSAAFAISVSVNPAVKTYYEHRANVDLGESVPFTSWFDMGIHEAMNAPGWYNPTFTLRTFEKSNYDAEIATEKSKESIRNQIQYFKDNPQYRKEFFYQKFMSQWNETTYQSIWNNKIRQHYYPMSPAAEWVCGAGEKSVKQYMDYYAQLIFAACMAGLIACLKNRNFLSVTFPVVILGGMLYHILAEAKSQYSLPYFILMIGFAAYGIVSAYDYFKKRTGSSKFAKLIFNNDYLKKQLADIMTSEETTQMMKTDTETPQNITIAEPVILNEEVPDVIPPKISETE
ncbi:MAG: hypothetical protein IKJ87_08375 [Ruminococcus sp.]|nr:hypothetical protein [Ruminococcus sp.]